MHAQLGVGEGHVVGVGAVDDGRVWPMEKAVLVEHNCTITNIGFSFKEISLSRRLRKGGLTRSGTASRRRCAR